MKPIVWVVQEGKNDYSPAEDFGEVRFITESDLRSMEDSRQNAAVEHDIIRFKASYAQGIDYIIPVGNPMLVVKIAMSLPSGEHKFLKWDGRRAAYIAFNVKGS